MLFKHWPVLLVMACNVISGFKALQKNLDAWVQCHNNDRFDRSNICDVSTPAVNNIKPTRHHVQFEFHQSHFLRIFR